MATRREAAPGEPAQFEARRAGAVRGGARRVRVRGRRDRRRGRRARRREARGRPSSSTRSTTPRRGPREVVRGGAGRSTRFEASRGEPARFEARRAGAVRGGASRARARGRRRRAAADVSGEGRPATHQTRARSRRHGRSGRAEALGRRSGEGRGEAVTGRGRARATATPAVRGGSVRGGAGGGESGRGGARSAAAGRGCVRRARARGRRHGNVAEATWPRRAARGDKRRGPITRRVRVGDTATRRRSSSRTRRRGDAAMRRQSSPGTRSAGVREPVAGRGQALGVSDTATVELEYAGRGECRGWSRGRARAPGWRPAAGRRAQACDGGERRSVRELFQPMRDRGSYAPRSRRTVDMLTASLPIMGSNPTQAEAI